ncbi:MAG TPA: MIP/aquaporin family protein [Candidatus Sulfotelmatobacter sp.]|nr:MIP/aquaporin family protein [Candidatus Sulfotelmatobacter sp.]
MTPSGEAALRAAVGPRFSANWHSPRHRMRRLLSEFIGTAGFMFLLSGGAAVLARYGGAELPPFAYAAILSGISALWLIVAVYFLGDISAHFNPAMTFAFALRRDMGWPMACAYVIVQFIAAICGTFLAKALFGTGANLAATIPKPGLEWPSVLFEAILVFGLVLMVLGMANGPKLDGAYIPLAVGAYVMSVGTMGGPYDGAAFNPARAFSPDLAIGDLSTYWVYPLGALIGACVAVLAAHVLRGAPTIQEAQAAMGTPLDLSEATKAS